MQIFKERKWVFMKTFSYITGERRVILEKRRMLTKHGKSEKFQAMADTNYT